MCTQHSVYTEEVHGYWVCTLLRQGGVYWCVHIIVCTLKRVHVYWCVHCRHHAVCSSVYTVETVWCVLVYTQTVCIVMRVRCVLVCTRCVLVCILYVH